MKKLMLVLAIVAAAVAAHAGVVKWSTGKSQYVYKAGSTSTKLSGNAIYIFDATDGAGGYTQSAFVEAIVAGSVDLTKALDSSTITSTGTFSDTFDAVADRNYSLFVAVVDGDSWYVSDLKPALGPSTPEGTAAVSYSPKTTSQLEALDAKDGFAGAGWYTAEAVPEPFSGTLALLGMGAIALRRKMKKAKKA